MTRPDADQRITPSLLDRLAAEADPSGRPARFGFDLRQMVDAVRRDLEDLLNTRRTAGRADAFPEVSDSVVTYGMPDLASMSAGTEAERAEVGRVIEAVIHRFEPRLREVHAHLVGGVEGRERSLRFHIQARLAVDPMPEVGFDTVLELTTGYASVRRSEG